jgi:hypothetical protein
MRKRGAAKFVRRPDPGCRSEALRRHWTGYLPRMSFTATVENDVIKLPENTHLPNGSTVRIEVIEKPRIAPEVAAWLDKISGKATSGLSTDEIMRESRGEE